MLLHERAQPPPETPLTLPQLTTDEFNILQLRQKFAWSNLCTTETWTLLTDSGKSGGSLLLDKLEKSFADGAGWVEDGRVRSILGYIRLIFSIPELELHIETAPKTPPECVREFSETNTFRELEDECRERHATCKERAGQEFYAIALLMFTDKFGKTNKTSLRTVFVDILNMETSIRNVPWVSHFVTLCDKKLSSFYNIISALAPELRTLRDGCKVWCERTQQCVWVYGVLLVVGCDSAERGNIVSVNPPNSKSHSCCTSCHALQADLAAGRVKEPRDWKAAMEAIRAARAALPPSKTLADIFKRLSGEPADILRAEHLHRTALVNPIFCLPLFWSPFLMVPSDTLHPVLFRYSTDFGGSQNVTQLSSNTQVQSARSAGARAAHGRTEGEGAGEDRRSQQTREQ